jgi:ribosomal protein L11
MVLLHLNIKAGMAISGPPLGPTLGQYGISIGPFCDSFNEQTLLFKSTYPLNVYLYLNKDGSYNYYIYFPRLVFFLKKLLKKENGPAETPRYSYFIGYLLMKASTIKERHNKLLCQKISDVFKDQSLEIEKIDLKKKYSNIFRKGSFRSITPELLFETIIFYSMASLEIKGLFCYFFELRDYFIIDYVPFFFFFDYIQMYSNILSRYSFDNLDSNIILFNTIETNYNINFLFSKYNNLFKIVELLPESINLYSSSIKSEDIIKVEFYPMYYIYYYADLLSELDFDSFLFSNHFIGFDFNFDIFLRSNNFIENPLILLNNFVIKSYSIKLNNWFEDIDYITEDNIIFTFSMYITYLYFSQYEYYTDYDFRDISKYQNLFKQINSYLKHQGIFLMTKYSYISSLDDFSKQYSKPLFPKEEDLIYKLMNIEGTNEAWIA